MYLNGDLGKWLPIKFCIMTVRINYRAYQYNFVSLGSAVNRLGIDKRMHRQCLSKCVNSLLCL